MTTKERATELFKHFISREIERSRSRRPAADAYHSAAARTGLGYDHIYQVYKGKPSGKVVSVEALSRLVHSYRDDPDFADLVGAAPSLFVESSPTTAPESPATEPAPDRQTSVVAESIAPYAVARTLVPPEPGPRYLVSHLGALLRSMDKTDRKQAAAILENLALHPEDAELMGEKLSKLLGETQQAPTIDNLQANQK